MDKEYAAVTCPDQLVCAPEIGLHCFECSFAGHSTEGKDSARYSPYEPAPDSLPPNHKACKALYKPFEARWLTHKKNSKFRDYYFEPGSNRPFRNPTICVSNGTDTFSALMCDIMPDYHLLGQTRCFPLYRHDGQAWKPNVSDGILAHFRERYGRRVTKAQIFYYVYGVLHLPAYRSRYSNNLRRSFPRIPLVPSRDDFARFAGAGRWLARLHCMRDVRFGHGDGIVARLGKSTKVHHAGSVAAAGRPALSIDAIEARRAGAPGRSGRVLEIRTTLRRKGSSAQATMHVHGVSDDSYDDCAAYSVDLWSPFKWLLKRTQPDISFQDHGGLRSYVGMLGAIEVRSGKIILGLPTIRRSPFRPIPQDPRLPLTHSEHIRRSRLAKAK